MLQSVALRRQQFAVLPDNMMYGFARRQQRWFVVFELMHVNLSGDCKFYC